MTVYAIFCEFSRFLQKITGLACRLESQGFWGAIAKSGGFWDFSWRVAILHTFPSYYADLVRAQKWFQIKGCWIAEKIIFQILLSKLNSNKTLNEKKFKAQSSIKRAEQQLANSHQF